MKAIHRMDMMTISVLDELARLRQGGHVSLVVVNTCHILSGRYSAHSEEQHDTATCTKAFYIKQSIPTIFTLCLQ